MTFKIQKTDAHWQAELQAKGAEPLAFQVTRQAATERPFSGRLAQQDDPGTYHCICCDQPLFQSDARFDAGCGWPSYVRPVSEGALATRADHQHDAAPHATRGLQVQGRVRRPRAPHAGRPAQPTPTAEPRCSESPTHQACHDQRP